MAYTAADLFDADTRIDRLLLIASLVAAEAASPDFTEFCQDLPEGKQRPLYLALPRIAAFADGDWPDPEMVADELRSGPTGFIVLAATPVRTYTSDGRSWVCSWGRYYSEWLYADSENAIAAVSIAWAKERQAADLSRTAVDPAP